MNNPARASRKTASATVISLCMLLAVAGVAGEGVLRWIFLALALVIAIILAIRVYRYS